jgi:hypothetical protein
VWSEEYVDGGIVGVENLEEGILEHVSSGGANKVESDGPGCYEVDMVVMILEKKTLTYQSVITRSSQTRHSCTPI